MQTPCYKCERRYLGCHSECPEYIEFSRERNEMLDKRHEERRLLNDNEIIRGRRKGWLNKEKKKRR
jgi:hypothetical protein